eukprot:TRINITY_DN696_c0_g1_i3.p1 TRINITY_DN696_c0_g1~~TRINITY_DN696_c0_g1_i3.p1  ORF type:complete len:343 (-),score=-3.71 TRINITY_DN696_c0_g1_i3:2784-3812(-)
MTELSLLSFLVLKNQHNQYVLEIIKLFVSTHIILYQLSSMIALGFVPNICFLFNMFWKCLLYAQMHAHMYVYMCCIVRMQCNVKNGCYATSGIQFDDFVFLYYRPDGQFTLGEIVELQLYKKNECFRWIFTRRTQRNILVYQYIGTILNKQYFVNQAIQQQKNAYYHKQLLHEIFDIWNLQIKIKYKIDAVQYFMFYIQLVSLLYSQNIIPYNYFQSNLKKFIINNQLLQISLKSKYQIIFFEISFRILLRQWIIIYYFKKKQEKITHQKFTKLPSTQITTIIIVLGLLRDRFKVCFVFINLYFKYCKCLRILYVDLSVLFTLQFFGDFKSAYVFAFVGDAI